MLCALVFGRQPYLFICVKHSDGRYLVLSISSFLLYIHFIIVSGVDLRNMANVEFFILVRRGTPVELVKTKKGWTQLADVAARRRPKLVEAERRVVVWRRSASCP